MYLYGYKKFHSHALSINSIILQNDEKGISKTLANMSMWSQMKEVCTLPKVK